MHAESQSFGSSYCSLNRKVLGWAVIRPRSQRRLRAVTSTLPARARNKDKNIKSLITLNHRDSLSLPPGEGRGGASQRASLSRPLGRAGEGLSLCFFLNTEDAEFTEYHPAHFDKASAASRQRMTRNMHTHITRLLNSPTLRAPIAPASPAPLGRVGEGLSLSLF